MRDRSNFLFRLSLISVVVLGIVTIVTVQFLTPTLYEADGYLHIRMAEFIKKGGPITNFHWARYSHFAQRFADKDFLYHVLIIPFTTFKNIFFGAKVAACLFAIGLFIVFLILLKYYSTRKFIPIILLSFFLSDHFLQALSRTRPMILAITLTLLGIYFIMRENYWGIFFTTLIFSLTHLFAPFMLLYALVYEITKFVTQKKFSLKIIGAITLALLVGIFVHPNFPNNLFVFYLNAILVPYYAAKGGVLELGGEFFPLNTRDYFFSYPLIPIGLVLMLFIGLVSHPKTTFKTKLLFIYAAVHLILSLLSQRYIIHGYPIILLFFASYLSDWMQGRTFYHICKQNKPLYRTAIVFCCLVGLLLGMNTYKGILQLALVERIVNTHYERMGNLMAQYLPPGEVIFHANWSDSQYFIGLNPKDDYFVTLDPIYMYHWNPAMYKEYRDVAFGRASDPYRSLKETFKVNFGYAGKNYFGGLIEQVRRDSRFSILGEDGLGVLFQVK